MAVGLALAERMLAARYNRPGHDLIDHRTFAIASDGDMQEGVPPRRARWPATSGSASSIAFYDDNHIQLDGETAMAFSEDVGEALRGLRLARPGPRRGHRARAHETPRSTAAGEVDDRPSLIVLRTHIGYGSPEQAGHREGARLAARRGGGPPDQGGLRLGPDAHFLVPDEALAHFREAAGERGAAGRGRVERARRRLPRRAPRRWAELSLVAGGGACPRAGTPTRRASRPTTARSPRARRPAGDPVGRRAGAAAGRRLGRPRAARRSRRSRTAARSRRAPTGGATCTSASASTRWARSSTASTCTAARLRRDLPHLLRLHEGRDPARRAAWTSRRSSSSPTTRSAWARTARPTSRSSSSRTCARRRTSTSCARPERTRRRSAWQFALSQTDTPTRSR